MEKLKKYLKHPGLWINMLLGRPNPINIPPEQVTHQETDNGTQTSQPQKPPQPPSQPQSATDMSRQMYEEDPLKKDLQKVTGVLSKLTARAQKVAAPVVSKGRDVTAEATAASGAFVKTDKFKKIIPLFVFAVVLAILGFVGYIVLQKFLTKPEVPVVITEETPTPVSFTPSLPSVYAEDAETLKLEEDIGVLDREIAGTSLRETTLNPPVLDFNITFK